METLVLPLKKTDKTLIDKAICCIDITENTIYYEDSSVIKYDNALELCRQLKLKNSDYEYVWHNFCRGSRDDNKARYLVNFKLIQNIYSSTNYYNVTDYDNLTSKQNLRIAFKRTFMRSGDIRCTVDFDNNYISSFTDSMMRVLGYNPFNLNLL